MGGVGSVFMRYTLTVLEEPNCSGVDSWPRRNPLAFPDGVRILELARWQAAPRGGMILRDMGAEVIKLEWSKSRTLETLGRSSGT
ncbi:MAG: hypothetical protein Ct9H300mP11_23600 [Chloroflexota bacterium]|nr:MAG: hypothetical protein Ct9H300mP11_23600 [Chloroflexota bacterium]